MRQPRRIGVILSALKSDDNKRKVLEKWFKPKEGVQLSLDNGFNDIDVIIKKWTEEYANFANFWVDNTDLRLPQLLINMGIMPNYPGFYYHKEDEDTMISSGVLEAGEILFWGNNYDKDNNLLSETRWVLPTEMNTGHLEAIVDLEENGKMKVNELYLEMFKKELKSRK